MRFLIVSVDYPAFLRWLYGTRPGLAEQPYEEQKEARVQSLFGTADFYSTNLRALGHEAWDVWPNNEPMQRAWAREHGVRVSDWTPTRRLAAATLRRARVLAAQGPLDRLKPVLRSVRRRLEGRGGWLYDILAAQIREYRPDILLNQAVDVFNPAFFSALKPKFRLLVGQVASPLAEDLDLRRYDLLVSSLPNFVANFRRLGVPSELNRLGFEPAVLGELKSPTPEISVSFVGSLSSIHHQRIFLLEHLCSQVEISVWGNGVDRLLPSSSISSRHNGPAWGLEAYRILQASKVTVNNHESVADSYANNMRLFEATGVGTLLVTDWKVNLHEMFEPGKEVVAYHSPEECAELIRYYLEHERGRKDIARAGQQRTLRDHTFYRRAQELVDIVERHSELLRI